MSFLSLLPRLIRYGTWHGKYVSEVYLAASAINTQLQDRRRLSILISYNECRKLLSISKLTGRTISARRAAIYRTFISCIWTNGTKELSRPWIKTVTYHIVPVLLLSIWHRSNSYWFTLCFSSLNRLQYEETFWCQPSNASYRRRIKYLPFSDFLIYYLKKIYPLLIPSILL